VLLGNPPESPTTFSPTGLSPSTVAFPTLRLTPRHSLSRMAVPDQVVPQPRTRNACQLSHAHGLASSAFARHYSRNHYCFLFLRVLRCFTSPRSPHCPIHSGSGDGHHSGRVTPFGHPRITARLAAPRGLSQPPTSFIGSWCQGIHRVPTQLDHKDAQPPTQTTTSHQHPHTHTHSSQTTTQRANTPTACSLNTQHNPTPGKDRRLAVPQKPSSTSRPRNTRQTHPKVLLRKEVIQPHLPVRLPCYDFVPIASPTFDRSLPQRGLGHGLRVLPTFVT
jgi:hypothetical protein